MLQVSTCTRADRFDGSTYAFFACRKVASWGSGRGCGVHTHPAYRQIIFFVTEYPTTQPQQMGVWVFPRRACFCWGRAASWPKFLVSRCVWEKSGARFLVNHTHSCVVERSLHEGLAAQPSAQAPPAATPRTVQTYAPSRNTSRHHCRRASHCVKKGIDRFQSISVDYQLFFVFLNSSMSWCVI